MAIKVLVADDDELIVASMAAILRRNSQYEVLLAKDGDEALEIAQREKPDLLLLDIMMPRRNGLKVCQALRGDPTTAHIKVIMVTGLTHKFDRSTAMEAGANDYLAKPFSPTVLLEKVDALLASG